MYLVGHIRKIGDFADGTKLFFQPDEEVIDAGAADRHLEGRFRLCGDAQAASGLFGYASYGFHGDDAAAGYPEELVRVEVVIHDVQRRIYDVLVAVVSHKIVVLLL